MSSRKIQFIFYHLVFTGVLCWSLLASSKLQALELKQLGLPTANNTGPGRLPGQWPEPPVWNLQAPAPSAQASDVSPNMSLRYQSQNKLKLVPEQVLNDLTAPMTTDASALVFAGAVLSGDIYFMRNGEEYNVRNFSMNKRQMNPKHAEFAGKLGSGWLPFTYATGFLLHGYLTRAERSRYRGVYMAKTALYTLTMTIALKKFFNHPRPGAEGILEAFPSGHSSSAYAFATAVSIEHEWYWGLLAHSTAFAISYSRLQMNRHYLQDIVAGATLGASYAWGLSLQADKKPRPYWVALLPQDQLRGAGLFYAHQF